MDFGDMTIAEIRQLITDAERAVAEREAVEAARVAVSDAVEGYAGVVGVTVLQAWRELPPEGVDVPDDPDPITAPEWVQPQAHNPYMKGDLVTYKGVVDECTRDDNVWSPLAYPQGWKEVR